MAGIWTIGLLTQQRGEDFVQTLSYAGETRFHPVALAALAILSLATLIVRRRSAILPMLLMAGFITGAQRFVLPVGVGDGLDFSFLRIMTLVGLTRVLLRNEFTSFRWMTMDKLMIAYGFSKVVIHTILWGSATAFIYRMGWCLDTLGMYFLFRILIRTWDDLDRVATVFTVMAVPVAALFILELMTAKNLFSVLGGVSLDTDMREGRLRCGGPFAHPIIAGVFWAGMAPLIASCWWGRQRRLPGRTMLGLCCVAMIVLATASSTPISAVMAGLVGVALFPLRHNMWLIRWGGVLGVISLHMVMKAPVWHLISRIDLVGGSTGWHRFALIDACIRKFGSWWLCGVRSTASWGHHLFDVTCQYVSEAVTGGLVTLSLFLFAIVVAFRSVSRIMRAEVGAPHRVVFAWLLGVALFQHCTSFIAVSYFDKAVLLWYMMLAVVTSIENSSVRSPEPARMRGLSAKVPSERSRTDPSCSHDSLQR